MSASSYTPVAVIGMACRLPGGIDSPDSLWTALLGAEDLVSTVPPGRWDADDYYDPQPGVPGRSVSKWGGFIDDVAGFDAEFFGIGGAEATAIDPQHRVLLETAWEAVEHAGIDPKSLVSTRTRSVRGHDPRRLPVAGRRRQCHRGPIRVHRHQLQPGFWSDRLRAGCLRPRLHGGCGLLIGFARSPPRLPQPR